MKEAARQVALNISGAGLVLATLGMLGYVGWGLMNKEMAINNKDAMMLFLGVLLAKYSDLIAFFFGSSASSKKQADTIDKLADTTKVAQAMPAAAKPDATVTLEPGETAKVSATDNGEV